MPKGDLIIIGGSEDKQGEMQILKKFVKLSGGRSAVIGVLTTATNFPEEVGEEYNSLFQKLGVQETFHFNIDCREDGEDEKYLEKLPQVTGIFMTGGKQIRLTSILGGTSFYALMQKQWQEGLIIGGTSAGAAVQSRHMILSSTTTVDHEQIEMGSGFGFVEDAIIDQHFSQRARFNRLMYAIARNPQVIGIGIDENTAIWVKEEGKYFEVLGEQIVTVFDGKNLKFVDIALATENHEITISGVQLHSLARGYQFDLVNRKVILRTEEEK